jgi:hypothetical protein
MEIAKELVQLGLYDIVIFIGKYLWLYD